MRNLCWIIVLALLVCEFSESRCRAQLDYSYRSKQPSAADPDSLSDEQIILYLSKWKIKGVRPSKEAYMAVLYYGDHAVRLINEFGEDALSVLDVVSGTSAVALSDMTLELQKVRQVYPLLNLIARHPQADLMVKILAAHESELATSVLVETLLKSPDEVLQRGPLITMAEITAIHQQPTTPLEHFYAWLGRGSGKPDQVKESSVSSEHLFGLFSLGFAGLLVGILRYAGFFKKKSKSQVKPSGEPPRIAYRPSRPIPAFRMKL